MAIQKKVIAAAALTGGDFGKALTVLKKHTSCENAPEHALEACVLSKLNVIPPAELKHNFDENFLPVGPVDSTEWFSNVHIDSVLEQAAKYFKGFFHIPFQMIDFSDFDNPDKLHNIDLVKHFSSGVTSFGVVINTDVTQGQGEHWFSIYGTFTPKSGQKLPKITLEYFNSSGESPRPSIETWLRDTSIKLEKAFGVPVEIIRHKIVHQTDTHSCGPYALYYILSRLSGVPSDTFSKKIIPSSTMVEFRANLVRKSPTV